MCGEEIEAMATDVAKDTKPGRVVERPEVVKFKRVGVTAFRRNTPIWGIKRDELEVRVSS